MLSNISFSNASGGLGRLPLGEDYTSALVATIAAGAAGFAVGELMKEYRSLAEVEAAGITEVGANALTWYHVREFFRMAGPSVLWIINSGPFVTIGNETVIQTSQGKIRQMAYVTPVTNTNISAEVIAKNAIANAWDILGAPVSILLGVADSAIASYSALLDMRTFNSPKVSIVSMGDGSGKGNTLATTLALPLIPAVGTVLGAIASASVNESIAWVAKFNMSDGTDFVKFRDAKGQSNVAATDAILTGIDDKGYIFFRTFIGLSGAYINASHTAVAISNDFATIENNRSMDKAKRLIKATFIADLNSPLTLQPNGKLAPDTVKYFENKAGTQLDNMQNAGEISNYSVLVDPEQNVLSTSTLNIKVRIQPRGVARFLVINIGFAVNVTL
jgi:Protein of unknown function (DUF2586)